VRKLAGVRSETNRTSGFQLSVWPIGELSRALARVDDAPPVDPDAVSPLAFKTVEFSRELRNDVLAGDITVSVRLWRRARVKEGGRYLVGLGAIEVDAVELIPFSAITGDDVRRAGEPDRETLRRRAAHAGPIDDDTLVYRIEFHAVTPGD
jgi:hypothetical protein